MFSSAQDIDLLALDRRCSCIVPTSGVSHCSTMPFPGLQASYLINVWVSLALYAGPWRNHRARYIDCPPVKFGGEGEIKKGNSERSKKKLIALGKANQPHKNRYIPMTVRSQMLTGLPFFASCGMVSRLCRRNPWGLFCFRV